MQSKSQKSLDTPGMRFSEHISEHSKTIGENLVRLDFLMDNIDFNNRSVLFSGCGTGYEVNYLATHTHCKKITGIDISKDAIEHARRGSKHDSVEFSCQDAMATNFQEETFDIVISLEVLEHITSQQTYVKEQWRILKRKGILALSTPNRMVFSAGYPKSRNKTHINELNQTELHNLLGNDFQDVMIFGQRLKDPEVAQQHLASVKGYHEHRLYCDTKYAAINLLRWMKLPVIIFRMIRKPGPDEGYEMNQFVIDKNEMDWAIWHIAICHK
jgi:SAM-dependent methyltransferase